MSSPGLSGPGTKRPMGVVFAAIVLALMALFGFLAGALVVFLTLFVRPPQLTQYPLLEAVEIVVGIVVLLISGLCAWTVVGLFRLQKWARISVVILGGVLAFFSFVNAIVYLAIGLGSLEAFVPAPNAPTVSPLMIKMVFLGLAGFAFLCAGIGVWWLVYFNLRRIRELFSMDRTRQLLEFALQPVATDAGVWIDPTRPKRSVIEVLVIVLGLLYLFGALWGVAEAFVRFPLFLLGHIFRGSSAGIFGLAMGVIDAGLGVGLLRRMKAAWIVALVFNALGLVYTLEMLSPRYQAGMADYQKEIMRRTLSGIVPVPPPPQLNFAPVYVLSAILGVLMVGAVFWLLLRARPLFEQKELAN
jgi:hypothetical protein